MSVLRATARGDPDRFTILDLLPDLPGLNRVVDSEVLHNTHTYLKRCPKFPSEERKVLYLFSLRKEAPVCGELVSLKHKTP